MLRSGHPPPLPCHEQSYCAGSEGHRALQAAGRKGVHLTLTGAARAGSCRVPDQRWVMAGHWAPGQVAVGGRDGATELPWAPAAGGWVWVGAEACGWGGEAGVPKASGCPPCLVCQTWFDLAGAGAKASTPRGVGAGWKGRARPSFYVLLKSGLCCGLAGFVPSWKQWPFLGASAPERGEHPHFFVSHLSSALCLCLGVALTPQRSEKHFSC